MVTNQIKLEDNWDKCMKLVENINKIIRAEDHYIKAKEFDINDKDSGYVIFNDRISIDDIKADFAAMFNNEIIKYVTGEEEKKEEP